MGWVFGIGVPVLLIVLFVVAKGRKYNAIYSAPHYIELAESLQRAKDAACQKIGEPPSSSPMDDDRVILTSARIASMYTVDESENGFSHYFSISIAGSYTPHAVGGTFTVYLTNLLGIPHSKLQLGISEANVYHCRYELTPAEHSAVEGLKVSVPTEDSAAGKHQESMADRDKLQWARIQAGQPLRL